MEIPIWALSVLGFFATIVTISFSHYLSKSRREIEDLKSENHQQNLEISTLKVKQEDSDKNNVKEFKQVSDLLMDIKSILERHAISLNHMDKNSAVTAEALKRMMKLEDDVNSLTKKMQQQEVKLEVLMSK
jgi:Tfp pilus assembly protein PilE